MRPATAAFLSLGWAMAGCNTETVFVGLPEVQDAQSLISHVRSADGSRYAAHQLTDQWSLEVEAESVTLIFFGADLDALNLPEGALEPGALDCALLDPLAAFETSGISASKITAWTEVDARTSIEPLIPDAADRCSRCRTLRVEQVDLAALQVGDDAETTSTDGAAFLKDGRAMVTRKVGGVFAVDRSGLVTPLPGCDDERYSSVAAVDERRFWAGRNENTLDLIEIDVSTDTCRVLTSTVVTSPGAPSGEVVSIDGKLDPEDPEIYVATTAGLFSRILADRIEPIAEIAPRTTTMVAYSARVARIGDGEAALSSGSRDLVLFTAPDTLRSVQIELGALGADSGLEDITVVDGLGIIMGTSEGEIYQYASRELVPLGGRGRRAIGSVVPYKSGFIALTEGFLLEYQPDLTLCEAVEAPFSTPARNTILDGDVGFVPLMTSPNPNRSALAAWIYLE